MACKILGIVSTERSWEKMKRVMFGDWGSIGSDVAKTTQPLQVFMLERTNPNIDNIARAGDLCGDEDIEIIKLDLLCLPPDADP